MKTGEFIISLAKQSGSELTEDQTTAISEIATDLPDDIATKIQGSLFTMESALANPDIINKLKAESLDAVDQKMLEFATEFGLDDGFKHNLKETKGTYNRIDSIKKAVLENHKLALEKVKEGAPAGDQEELQKEISKLNAQIALHNDNTVSQQDHDDAIEGYEDMLKEGANKMLGLKANSLFAGQNWAMDISQEANMATAMGLFNSELANKNINLVDDNGLKLQTKEGSPYYVENKEVSPQDFANTLLAGHKLLKVTDTTTATTPTTTTVTGAGNGEIHPSVVGALAQLKAAEDAKTLTTTV